MVNYQKVKSSDNIILSKTVRKKGYTLDTAPVTDVAMFESSIESFLHPAFGREHQSPEDSYFMPGRHKDKVYRYSVQDCQTTYKDEFKFCLIPIDIDIKDDQGRVTWSDAGIDADDTIDWMLNASALIWDHAAVHCTSRGGIRIVFVLDHYVNALEWRFLYKSVVDQLAEDFGGEFGKFNKLKFTFDKLTFILDPRNPGSLTRVPFGFRDGAPVSHADYFRRNDYCIGSEQLPINHFGKIQELDQQVMTRDGYQTVNLNLPRPKKLAKLPENIRPFRWPGGEPPGQGEREIAIFSAVGLAKFKYTDRLTPEQYYAYFYDAISAMDATGAVIRPLDQLWMKIIRNYYQRCEAASDTGKKQDSRHLRNSGGVAFYTAESFDTCLLPHQLYRYAKNETKELIDKLLLMQQGTVFLNPPPGAGKSTAACVLLETKGGIYLAPSNKQIKDISKKLQQKHNICLSYKELIHYICGADTTTTTILLGKYAEHNAAYKEARANVELLNDEDAIGGVFDKKMIIRNGTFYRVKSFPQYIEEQFPIESEKIHRENHARIRRLEKGELSLLTKDKFMTLLGRDSTLGLPDDHQIIYDEAEPEDIIDPEIYSNKDPVRVYGIECHPEYMISNAQEAFVDFLKKRPTIFINANRGLDSALSHNGFDDVITYGADMQGIIDNDLHIVLSPDLKAGFTEHRNLEDDTETSPRALYASQVNQNVYTLMTNGRDVSGNTLATDNLKRVIGSNDYINSKVLSIITMPTPGQVAELCFCTGMKPESAKRVLFENLINQVISRNVGYRGHAITSEISYHDLHAGRPDHKNEHILVLPESVLDDELDLIVKTTKVWTSKSETIPPQIKPYLHSIPLECKTRAKLYNVAPGDHTTLKDLSKSLSVHASKISFVLAELKKDPMLSDFHLIGQKRIAGVNHRNVIQRFKTIGELVRDAFREICDHFKFTDFLKILVDRTSKKFVGAIKSKDLKAYIREEAFRYDYRVIRSRSVEYLVRTGAEELFHS